MTTHELVPNEKGIEAFSDTNQMSIDRSAEMMIQSGYFKDMTEVSQAAVKVGAGRQLGLPDLVSMNSIYVVKGRLSMEATIMAQLIQASKRYNYRVTRIDNDGCVIAFFERSPWAINPNENGWEMVGEASYFREDAALARHLAKDTYKQHPRNMFWARAMSNGAKWYCAEVFGGPVYTPGELGEEKGGEPEEPVMNSVEQKLSE